MFKLFKTRHFMEGKPRVRPGQRPGSWHQSRLQAGFTIAELIVVIAIFTIITSIALFDQGNLNSNVLLTNIAYETALSVREAQVYGLGVQNSGDPTNGFLGDYGTHFDVTNDTTKRQIIVYANGTNSVTRGYDAIVPSGPPEQKYLYQFTNQRGNMIRYICLGTLDISGHKSSCDPQDAIGSQIMTQSLDIVFKRPEPGPQFFTPTLNKGLSAGPAYIVVTTLDGSNCKVVVVNATGQISVEGSGGGHCTPH